MLLEERRAARAQALCALGRHAEAERELAKLPQASPQAARVRQLCGASR
jgi:Tetratricopeptide repeat